MILMFKKWSGKDIKWKKEWNNERIKNNGGKKCKIAQKKYLWMKEREG